MKIISAIFAEGDLDDQGVSEAEARATRERNHRQRGEALRAELAGVQARITRARADLVAAQAKLDAAQANTREQIAARMTALDVQAALDTLTIRVGAINDAIDLHDRSKP